jgi:hypothetical protein
MGALDKNIAPIKRQIRDDLILAKHIINGSKLGYEQDVIKARAIILEEEQADVSQIIPDNNIKGITKRDLSQKLGKSDRTVQRFEYSDNFGSSVRFVFEYANIVNKELRLEPVLHKPDESLGLFYTRNCLALHEAANAVKERRVEAQEKPIKTRAEFLEFLMSPLGSTQITENPMSYLPINYFVSDDALFTHEEYFHKNNYNYRERIESREKLSFGCYRRLVDWMLEMNIITPDYDALDFKRGYYSWGVPGIRTKILSIEEKTCFERVTHSTIKNNKNTVGTVHYFGRDGILTPSLKDGQELIIGKEGVAVRARILESDEIAIAASTSPAENKVIVMNCDGFTLEFDDTNRRIRLKDTAKEYVDPILQIRATGGDKLDSKFFNTVRQEPKDAYLNDLILSACVEQLIQKTTVETEKSSFNAVQEGLSLSPAAAIKYIIAQLALGAGHCVDIYRDRPIGGYDEETNEILNAY